jgi:hypothetical protein
MHFCLLNEKCALYVICCSSVRVQQTLFQSLASCELVVSVNLMNILHFQLAMLLQISARYVLKRYVFNQLDPK